MAVTAADLQIKFSSDTRAAEAGIDRMGSKVKGLGSMMSTALGTALGVVGGAGINAMIGGFGNLVKGALDFESAMANVNSIAQLSDSQLKSLSASVNGLATETAQAPQVLAQGLYDIYSSGFQGAEALEILEIAARGASAGMTDTATSSKVLTGVLNSGIEDLEGNALTAQKAMDILFKTVEIGVVTFPELANNMAQTLGPANALGISLEELGASYALITKQSVPVNQAETMIANLMKQVTAPTEELTAAVQDYGYETAYALVQAEGMPGLLQAMQEATGGNALELRKLITDQEAYNAVLKLLKEDGGQTYLDMLEEMDRAAGATDRALTKQAKSASFAMRQAKVAFQQAATVLIGALSPAIQLAARGMAWFATNALTPAIDGVIGLVQKLAPLKDAFMAAFGSGVGIDKLVEFLPESLSALEQPILRIADSLGDIKAAWDKSGLDGVMDVLGEELSVVVDATVDIAVALGEIVWTEAVDIAGRIKEWILGQLGLGGAGPDATGNATAGMTGGISIGDVAIAVGNLIVSSIAATANDIAPAIQAWIDGHPADSIVQVVNITELQPTFRSLSRNDYDGAIKRFLRADPIEITPEIDLRIHEAVQNAIANLGSGGAGGGGGIDWSGVTTWLQASWIAANPGTVIGTWVADDLGKALMSAISGAMEGWFGPSTSLADDLNPFSEGGTGPSVSSQIVDDIVAMLEGIPGQIADAVDMPDLDIDMPELPGWLTDNSLMRPFEVMAEGFNRVAGLIDTAWGHLQDVLGKIGGGASGGADAAAANKNSIDMSPLDDLGKLGDQRLPQTIDGGEIPVDYTLVPHYTWQTPTGQAFNPFGMGGDKSLPTASGLASANETINGGERRVLITLVPEYTWAIAGGSGAMGSGFSQGAAMLDGGVPDLPAMTQTVKIDADTTGMDAALSQATSAAQAFAGQSFTAKLMADNGDVAVKYTESMSWGGIWDAASFTGSLNADNSQAMAAIGEAMAFGQSFDGMVFTASISVDTSGLSAAVVAAQSAAAAIAAVLPHSPAKEGPLSVVPNFDYIADAAESSFSKLRPMAESHLGDWFGSGRSGVYGSDSRTGGTTNVNVNITGPIYGIDDFESAVVDTFQTKIGPAITVALGRRNRQLGA